MTPQTIANGSDPHVPGYADALATGEYAALVPGSHLETHQGRVELPQHEGQPENVLFPRVTNIGGFGICGQGHRSGLAWLWRDGAWSANGPTNGTSPCIFDAGGNLLVVRPGPDVTSQGYRYVDENGRVWTGDETYADQVRQIWEWSRLAGVTVGQGETGAHVLFDGDPAHRLLEDGDTRFIRLHEVGGTFAIVVVRPSGAAIYRGTRADLQALPVVAAQEPPREPPQEGGHEPPKEGPKMQIPARVIQNIKDLAARNNALLQGDDDQRRALMKLICEQNRFDLGPRHGWKAADPGRPPGKDAVAYQAENGDVYVADVFGGNLPRSYNGVTEYELTNPRQLFIPVDPVDHLGHGGEQGGEQPGNGGEGGPTSPDPALVKRIEDLERQQKDTADALQALDERVQALEKRPPASTDSGGYPTAKEIAAEVVKLFGQVFGKVA